MDAHPVMLDTAGNHIGLMAVIYAYKAGDDTANLQKKAEAIRDDLRTKTPSLEKLFEPSRKH